MDDYNTSSRKRSSRARQRREKRRERREARTGAMATIQQESTSRLSDIRPSGINLQPVGRGFAFLRDSLWHIINRSPILKLIPLVIVAILGVVWLASQFSGQIPPNVWALNVALGGRSVEDAEAALLQAWEEERINIRLEGETFAQVAPTDLGMVLDASAIVAEAQEQGIAGIPFGVDIEPVVTVNAGVTQAFLLSQVDAVYIPPYDAGFAWESDQLISISGTPSRELDVTGTLELIQFDPLNIYETRQLELQTDATAPNAVDATPYIDAAYRFINNGLIISGYDPFTDEYKPWGTNRNFLTQMLAVGPAGLSIREDRFRALIEVINDELSSSEQPRYLEYEEAQNAVQNAIASAASEAEVRIRYLPHEYTVESGDRGFGIARQHGLPFTLIQQANTGIDLDVLSVGDVITIPSRDAVVPLEPVEGKRIVVDLDRRWLVGFEDGEIAFDWQISIGLPAAPTSPGVFQVISKTEEAVGSSVNLCNSEGVCGQWRMEYFMGIYDVAENLTNGFHGVVHLPSGGLLGDGSIGAQNTYGCVMSGSENSQFLYQWADEGVVVEILSSEFQPQSDLARQAVEFMNSRFQTT